MGEKAGRGGPVLGVHTRRRDSETCLNGRSGKRAGGMECHVLTGVLFLMCPCVCEHMCMCV